MEKGFCEDFPHRHAEGCKDSLRVLWGNAGGESSKHIHGPFCHETPGEARSVQGDSEGESISFP